MSSLQPLTEAGFLLTKQYRLFAEFCDDTRKYRYIALCYGVAGVGKTWSARHYAKWEVIAPLPLTGTLATKLPLLPPEIADCRTIVYTARTTASPKQIGDDIEYLRTKLKYAVIDARNAQADYSETRRSSGRDYTELIIVDEADRLNFSGLEQIRDIYDRSHLEDRNPLGVIFIGMPGIEKRLARYPQLYSRVGFAHQFNVLTQNELLTVLENNWMRLGLAFDTNNLNTKEAVTSIINTTSGNFRLTERLFEQIDRVLAINELNAIDKTVVETAREMLVIGS